MTLLRASEFVPSNAGNSIQIVGRQFSQAVADLARVAVYLVFSAGALGFDFRAATDAPCSRAVTVNDRTPRRASERLLQTARAQRGRACESVAARKAGCIS